MTDAPAAFSGDYVDLKFIKSRKVAQIIVEIPIENSAVFVASFGAPSPATGVPVAIARLVEGAPLAPSTEHPKDRRKWGDIPYTTQAALQCDKPAFWRFLGERFHAAIISSDTAAIAVRFLCGVTSRAELNTNHTSGIKWRELNADYEMWLRDADQ